MTTQKDIVQAMADHLGLTPDDIDQGANLQDDLGLGPVELTDLLNDLAAKFDIVFSPEDTDNLQTVADLIALVEDNLIE